MIFKTERKHHEISFPLKVRYGGCVGITSEHLTRTERFFVRFGAGGRDYGTVYPGAAPAQWFSGRSCSDVMAAFYRLQHAGRFAVGW